MASYFELYIMYTPQNNWRDNIINYNIDTFCVEHILKTNFTIEPKIFGHLRRPIAKWNSKNNMVENVTKKDFLSF